MQSRMGTAIVGVACSAGFIVITILVASGFSQSVDQQAALAVNHYDLGPVGTWLMVQLTNYGREVVWSLLVVIMLLVGGRRTKLLALELAVLFVAGVVIGDAAKLLVARPRPTLASGVILRVAAETDFSYPSGHALIVSIGAAFCFARFHRKILAWLFGLEAALVCYSRVYVGVHYPLDVVGGVLLGIAITRVGTVITEKYFGSILERLLEPISTVLKEGPLDV